MRANEGEGGLVSQGPLCTIPLCSKLPKHAHKQHLGLSLSYSINMRAGALAGAHGLVPMPRAPGSKGDFVGLAPRAPLRPRLGLCTAGGKSATTQKQTGTRCGVPFPMRLPAPGTPPVRPCTSARAFATRHSTGSRRRRAGTKDGKQRGDTAISRRGWAPQQATYRGGGREKNKERRCRSRPWPATARGPLASDPKPGGRTTGLRSKTRREDHWPRIQNPAGGPRDSMLQMWHAPANLCTALPGRYSRHVQRRTHASAGKPLRGLAQRVAA